MTAHVTHTGSETSTPRGMWWRITALIVTDLCAIAAWIYFFVLNHTRIVRPYRGGDGPNLMLVSNHQSPLDSFLIGLAAFFPRALFRPHLHPWNAAASEYWFRTPFLGWLARHLRCIPVRTKHADVSAVRTMRNVLPEGTMIFFPEGTRSRDGHIRTGRAGAGFVAHRSRARIIPVAIDGLLEAMPYRAPWPRIGKRLTISFGAPVHCDDLFARPESRRAAQAIVDRSMGAVHELHRELQAVQLGGHTAKAESQ